MVARVPLKGLHSVPMKLADGSRVTYHYAWRGGPRLTEAYGTPAFHAEFAAAHAKRKTPPADCLKGLIEAFKASTDYTELSEASRKAYKHYLKLIEDEYGTLPLAAAEDRQARGMFKEWRDGLAASPRAADYALQTLARVLSFGVDRGKLTTNILARSGRIYKADRAEKIWTEEHIERFMAVASPELGWALALAIWTGQRQGDLLRLGWSSYDGNAITLRQSKTGRRVKITVKETLRSILKAIPRRATTILTSTDELPWTSDGFRASWNKACKRAKIEGVTFHDLRGTAVTRLALSGCTVPEIASITGHSQRDAETILDKHYLGGRVELAEKAMLKLEKGTKTVKRAVKRSTVRGGKGT